ncbi:MAG TPA: glucose-6-phosphate dehydrogenase assembly protein OpcA [bacterium]|nr:glucose-6-phosphate dehydrogenase assembly protein OpcA [bacterium]
MSVSSQAIEHELTELWKETKPAKEGEPGLQRVYTTNLVAYAEDHDTGYRVERVLMDLTQFHPGRYILIRPAQDTGEAPLRYYVSGYCPFWTDQREHRVCCDIIKLVAQQDTIENLYGFTFSLLVPDLPVELWWPGDLPIKNKFFGKMAEASNRVWVDSARFKNPEMSIARLAAVWEKRFPNTLLADMNWVRIQRWRALIAELFDGPWAKFLNDIKQVTIEYGEGTHSLRSFFLALWMAGRLGWVYKGGPLGLIPEKLEFEGPRGPIDVLLKPVPVQDGKCDRIFAVGVMTGGDRPGIFTVVRDADPAVVVARAEVEQQEAFSRVVTFDHLHSNQVLAAGLRHQARDDNWMAVLQLAGSILDTTSL